MYLWCYMTSAVLACHKYTKNKQRLSQHSGLTPVSETFVKVTRVCIPDLYKTTAYWCISRKFYLSCHIFVTKYTVTPMKSYIPNLQVRNFIHTKHFFMHIKH